MSLAAILRKAIISSCFLLSILNLSAQDNFLRFHLQKNGAILQGNAVAYERDEIQGLISMDKKKWDGHSNYYCYILHYTDSDTLVEVIYPFDNAAEENRFPGALLNSTTGVVKIFDGVISPPYGKDFFVLIITENKVSIGNRRAVSVISKEDVIKLVKGSKLSGLYDPLFGKFTVQTLQIETRPFTEKKGLTRNNDAAKKQFVVGDSAEIFYTPVPQNDIVRDSFPLVDIVYPSADSRGGVTVATNGQKIMIRGVANDFKRGIRSVTINNVPVDSYRESGYFESLYEPVDGLNIADVSVENNAGYRRTIRVKFNYESPDKPVSTVGKDYLLVIGINKYSSWPTLNNARKDGSDFRKLMVEQFGFKPANVKELYDNRACKDSIFKQLLGYVKTLNPNDRLLIYFAGHGYYDPVLELGYWVPSEARMNASQDYINNLDVTRMISKMKAKSIFLIVDACYSGQLLRDMRNEQKGDYRSRLILCSGKLKPVPDGKPGENSPFAQQVLSFFKKEKGHDIAATALIESVKSSFKESAVQKPVGGSIDEVNDENGDFLFRASRN